jgi:nucleoside-diphosphate-sugar epimerase
VSKLLAEKAAWDFAEEQGLQLAVLNPALVLGPTLTPSITGSLQVFLQIMKGQCHLQPPQASQSSLYVLLRI